MNRRDFIRAIGLGTAALAVDPLAIVGSPACEVFEGYPAPYFTGFKKSMFSREYAGQFLWKVLWDDGSNAKRLTFWFVGCTVPANQALNEQYIRTALLNSCFTYTEFMDKIVLDFVSSWVVEATENPIIHRTPNPDFYPSHRQEHGDYPEEIGYCIHCRPELIERQNRMVPAKRMRILPGLATASWDTPIEACPALDPDKIIKDLINQESRMRVLHE